MKTEARGGTLLICLDNLGDLVFCSSLIPALEQLYPQAPIALWVKEYSAAVARQFPGSPTVYSCDVIWDKSPTGRGRGNLWRFVQTLWRLRRARFQTAVVCSRNWRASLCAWLLGIPERIGFDSEKARKFLTDPKQLPAGVHVTAGLATLLSASPAPPRLQAPHINLSPRHPLPEKFVVLHPFAGSPKRCLPLDGWKVLAEYIRAKGFSVIWFGSRFDFDAVPTEFAAPHELLGHFVDSNDMPASMSMLIKAHAFVGHDSGPLHIAGALGVPVLGLYLPGDWPRTRVTGPRENLCHVIHRQSPGQISTQDLTAAFNQLLATIS